MSVGRLAPTPSGALHLGNTVAFAAAWLSSRAVGGSLLLRMEDVDGGRARQAVADQIRRDLEWLELHWDREVAPQSTRDYLPWLARVPQTYRCTCTRAQIAGRPYANTCRAAHHAEGAVRFRVPDAPVRIDDRKYGLREVLPETQGDPVLWRRDGVPTYNLAVVADDIADGVTEVVRGADLLEFTAVQVRLWEAFGAVPPTWMHAPLILGPDGKKLSKSHGAIGVQALRDQGWEPADVWRLVLPWLGLRVDNLAEATPLFDPSVGPRGPIRVSWETSVSRVAPAEVRWTEEAQ